MEFDTLASKPLGFMDPRLNPSMESVVGKNLGASVAVAFVHSEHNTASWSHSMLDLFGYDVANNQRLWRGGYFKVKYGADGLVEARNRGVQQFMDQRPAEWLLWLDTDMGFRYDLIDQLLASADPVERPIVGGLCFAVKDGVSDGLNGWKVEAQPTIYDWSGFEDGTQGFAPNQDYCRDGMQECSATGSACVLIHYSVFEKTGPGWYDRIVNESTGQLLSEDLSFCMRAQNAGFPVWVNTAVKTSHAKTVWVGEEFYLGQRATVPVLSESVS